MTQIKIPFLERFRESMLNGTKMLTSRTRKFGERGDTFEAFGATFEVIRVFQTSLADIAVNLWELEGCSSKEEFVKVWEQIHPRKGLIAGQKVWVHNFKKVEAKP